MSHILGAIGGVEAQLVLTGLQTQMHDLGQVLLQLLYSPQQLFRLGAGAKKGELVKGKLRSAT